jgi:hypothetical protein
MLVGALIARSRRIYLTSSLKFGRRSRARHPETARHHVDAEALEGAGALAPMKKKRALGRRRAARKFPAPLAKPSPMTADLHTLTEDTSRRTPACARTT